MPFRDKEQKQNEWQKYSEIQPGKDIKAGWHENIYGLREQQKRSASFPDLASFALINEAEDGKLQE